MVDLRIRTLHRAFKRRARNLRRRLYASWVAGPRLRKRGNYLMVLNLHQVSPVFEPGINLPGCWTGVDRFKSLLADLQPSDFSFLIKHLRQHDDAVPMIDRNLLSRNRAIHFSIHWQIL